MLRKFLFILTCFCALAACAKEPATTFLPESFNGWQRETQTAKSGSDPAAIDAADSTVLKEYGFTDYESATYTRNDRTMRIKAARFKDSTGAYGAFTFYVQPQMQKEDIGDRAVSNNSRVLFFRGNILVDVTLEHVTAMSAADLRALADALPRLRGEASNLPSLLGNMPKQGLIPNTERYIEGPVALQRTSVPIPVGLIDFSAGPEVEKAQYRTHSGEGELIVVAYPTPQIAAERLRAWQAASLPGGPFYFRRSNRLLSAVRGSLPENEAQALLGSVNYDADVTWNQAPPDRNQDRVGFLVALIMLVVIVLVAALIIGLAFGGLRIWSKRLFQRRGSGPTDEVEIIQLNLKSR